MRRCTGRSPSAVTDRVGDAEHTSECLPGLAPSRNQSGSGAAPAPAGSLAGMEKRPPLVVAWETTRACPLACRHCRATAQRVSHPAELTHDEGVALVDDIARGFPGAVLI